MKIKSYYKAANCNLCGTEIWNDETYIEVFEQKICPECFEQSRHDLDIEEEGNAYICQNCGEPITEGYYYRFNNDRKHPDWDTYCVECIQDNEEEVIA